MEGIMNPVSVPALLFLFCGSEKKNTNNALWRQNFIFFVTTCQLKCYKNNFSERLYDTKNCSVSSITFFIDGKELWSKN